MYFDILTIAGIVPSLILVAVVVLLGVKTPSKHQSKSDPAFSTK